MAAGKTCEDLHADAIPRIKVAKKDTIYTYCLYVLLYHGVTRTLSQISRTTDQKACSSHVYHMGNYLTHKHTAPTCRVAHSTAASSLATWAAKALWSASVVTRVADISTNNGPCLLCLNTPVLREYLYLYRPYSGGGRLAAHDSSSVSTSSQDFYGLSGRDDHSCWWLCARSCPLRTMLQPGRTPQECPMGAT